MDSRLFEGFECRGLSMRQPWLGVAFGKNPASAARSHQQKFDDTAANPVADRGYLFAFPKFAELRQPVILRGGMGRAIPVLAAPQCNICDVRAHESRLPDAICFA